VITFRQLEALVAIAEFGTFDAAARALSTTQSAVSKRIHELESLCAGPLFDRSSRRTRLTRHGEAALEVAREVLDRRNRFLEQVNSKSMLARRFRFGVTELSSITWLARYVSAIRERYPNAQVEPEVAGSAELCERLARGVIEVAFVPEAAAQPQFAHTALPQHVDHAWMCAPNFDVESPLPLSRLGAYPILLQARAVGSDIVFGRWLERHKVQIRQIVPSNNLLAVLSLAISGVAIAYLPLPLCQPLVDQDMLRALDVRPALPRVRYAAVHVPKRSTPFTEEMIRLAQRQADFKSLFPLIPPPASR
jgi:DNA-binding transcriptional LysR family regulator